MQEFEIYNVIRQEIANNHSLMHWFTLLSFLSLLIGCQIIENRKTILSIFLPLISPTWAASILRFDYFIHRQAEYLRTLEAKIQQSGFVFPLWETWKNEHTTGVLLVPLADFVIFLSIIIPTAYILFKHTLKYFDDRKWKGGKIYVWTILVTTLVLLLLISFVPLITK